MIIIISGSTHTGKTLLAQTLLEKYKYPYFSIDHLKMGLIRSKKTELCAEDDEALTPYLWSIVSEIIKTAVENKQNLIVEGCYIPFDWQNSFSEDYLKDIKYVCIIMSEKYIRNNFDCIKENSNIIESRTNNRLNEQALVEENANNLKMCSEYNLKYILINDCYADISELCEEIL